MQHRLGYRVGKISQTMFPNYGWCARCETTWNLVTPHTIDYISCSEFTRLAWWAKWYPDRESPKRWEDSPTSGSFPICKKCWSELTPEERLPYWYNHWYNPRHVAVTKKNDPHMTDRDIDLVWEEIQTKILRGE